MQKLKTLDQLNEIAKLFVKGVPPIGERLGSRSYGLGDNTAISLLGENVEAFDEAVDNLLASIPRIKGTLSVRVLLDNLIPRLREKKWTGAQFARGEAEEFEKAICDLPLRKFRVIRRIFGVMLAPGTEPLGYGDFTIGFGKNLFHDVMHKPIVASSMKPADLDELYIECTVEARDPDRAVEMSDLFFYRFELMFRVLIGRRTKYLEVGILNYVGPQLRDSYVLAGDGPTSHSSAWGGALQHVPLNDPYFSSLAAPFPRLFGLLTRENNELEKHVVRCAEWTGQAIGDGNAASAFVKGAIALEVMFSANEKGVITPSIMAQIADSCAFLLGNTETAPREFEKEVKRLYGIRSAVVHSGKDSVDEEDLDSLLQICRAVISVLLREKEFIEIDTMDKLTDYFRSRKYSGPMRTQPKVQNS